MCCILSHFVERVNLSCYAKRERTKRIFNICKQTNEQLWRLNREIKTWLLRTRAVWSQNSPHPPSPLLLPCPLPSHLAGNLLSTIFLPLPYFVVTLYVGPRTPFLIQALTFVSPVRRSPYVVFLSRPVITTRRVDWLT